MMATEILPARMRAVALMAFGGPDELRMLDLPVPTAGPGEVLIRVHTVAANRQDIMIMVGRAQNRHPVPLPHVLGIDPAGVVVAHGTPGVGPEVGTRVVVKPAIACGRCDVCLAGDDDACPTAVNVGVHRQGGMAEYVAVPETNVFPIPDGVTFAAATAIAHSFPVALHMLRDRAALRPGEVVLVTGASGAIGSAAIQLARLMGARVVAAARGPDRVAYARDLGADAVIDYAADPDFARLVRAFEPAGADVYIESAGDRAIWAQGLAALARRGRVAVVGSHAGDEVALDLSWLYRTRASILGSSGSTRRGLAEVLAMAGRDEIAPNIHALLPLDDAREAFALLSARANRGKVILVVRAEAG